MASWIRIVLPIVLSIATRLRLGLPVAIGPTYQTQRYYPARGTRFLPVFCHRIKATSTDERTSFRRGHVFHPTSLLSSGYRSRPINSELFRPGELGTRRLLTILVRSMCSPFVKSCSVLLGNGITPRYLWLGLFLLLCLVTDRVLVSHQTNVFVYSRSRIV